MKDTILKKRLEELLALADVRTDGARAWDIQVHDGRFYGKVLIQGEMGLGESYVDGWWDCARVDDLICRLLTARLNERVRSRAAAFDSLKARIINLQSRARSFYVGTFHYDLDNHLFRCMLGERMIYSCGYWKGAETLDEAQENKLDLVCRKLGLEPGMRVLDVGCGWGQTAKFVAERYRVEVVGVTVSKEQAALAAESCRDLPVRIHLQDYRDVEGEFDRILSIGMFEHVGPKNYETFMRTMRRLLKDDGLFLLHTIGANRLTRSVNAWINRYVFPGAWAPSPGELSSASEDFFVLEDWQNFGADYDKTLMSWHDNFEHHWPELKKRYDERFHRLWRYFLLSSAGSFRARFRQLWQIVFSPLGVPGVYHAPR